MPKTVPGDQPCPLAQVAYLMNQRGTMRVPPEAQQWRPQAGPREASRWRISISLEQAEQNAKAPTVSVKPKPKPVERADSGLQPEVQG